VRQAVLPLTVNFSLVLFRKIDSKGIIHNRNKNFEVIQTAVLESALPLMGAQYDGLEEAVRVHSNNKIPHHWHIPGQVRAYQHQYGQK